MEIVERDVLSIKEDVQDIKQVIIPSIKETLATITAKLMMANMMGWLIALLLGFILYKLWEITALVYALKK